MPAKKSWGYIYIIRSVDRYKIGYAGNLKTLEKRIIRLRNLNAFNVTPVLFLRSRRAHNLEVELHKTYKHKHIHHEWFNLDDSDLDYIKQRYANDLYQKIR